MNSLLQLAQLCQKEMRKEAQRSQKVTQQTAPKARRLSREVYVCGALSKLNNSYAKGTHFKLSVA